MRILLGAALGAVGCLASTAPAQSPLSQPGFVAGGPAAVAGVAHALDQRSLGAESNFVNAYGEPFVTPAQYCDPMMGGGYGGGGYGPPGTGGDPYGGSYLVTEQCGPHYFDFSAEFLHYQRDAAFSNVPISYSGAASVEDDDSFRPNFNDNIAIGSGELDSESMNGFRLTGRIDVGALTVFEATYSGLYDSDDASVDLSANETTSRLFSVFSRYGTRVNGPTSAPIATASTAGQPIVDNDPSGPDFNPGGANYEETDFATRHDVTYDSELHNAEALLRRYWVGANPRVSGTLLAGFRYTSLSEELGFSSIGSTGPVDDTTGIIVAPFRADLTKQIDIRADADNQLAGFEIGGDAWVTVFQGFRIGGEAKVGIYNNDFEVSTTSRTADGGLGGILVTPGVPGDPTATPPVAEIPAVVDQAPDTSADRIESGNQVAFLTEVKLMAVADLTSSLSIKGGYELLFISDVALVGDSLLLAAPYGNPNGALGAAGGLPPSTSDDILFHGFHAGIEYVW